MQFSAASSIINEASRSTARAYKDTAALTGCCLVYVTVTHLCSLREACHCLHKVHTLALVLFEDIKDRLRLPSLRLQFCCHPESVYL